MAYFYFIIFLIPLVINPFGFLPFEIPKIAFLISIISIASVLYFFKAAFAKKIQIHWNKKATILAGIWAVSLIISTIHSLAPIESFWGTYERMEGLFTWTYYFLHFFLCIQLFQEEKIREKFIQLSIVLGAILSIIGIFQYFGIPVIPINALSFFTQRSYATVGQPTLFGQWLIFPFFAAFFKVFTQDKKLKDTITKKILYIASFIIIAIGVYTTINRATFLAIAISIIIYGVTILHQKKKHKTLLGLGVLTAVFSALVIYSGTFRSVFSRLNMWQSAIELSTKSPLIGNGLESFYQLFQTVVNKSLFITENMYVIPDRVHNIFLHTFIEQGLLGLSVMVAQFIILIIFAFKAKDLTTTAKTTIFGLIATFISLQFSFFFSAQYIYFFAFWALALHELKLIKTSTTKNHRPISVVAIILLIPFTIFSLSKGYNIIVGDMKVRESSQYIDVDPIQGLEYQKQVLAYAPNYSFGYKNILQLMSDPLILIDHPELIPQLKGYTQALLYITNNNFESLTAAARLYTAIGDYNTASTYAQQALLKAPNSAFALQTDAEIDYIADRYPEALKKFQKLLDLAPNYWNDPTDERSELFKKTTPLFMFALQEIEYSKKQTVSQNNK